MSRICISALICSLFFTLSATAHAATPAGYRVWVAESNFECWPYDAANNAWGNAKVSPALCNINVTYKISAGNCYAYDTTSGYYSKFPVTASLCKATAPAPVTPSKTLKGYELWGLNRNQCWERYTDGSWGNLVDVDKCQSAASTTITYKSENNGTQCFEYKGDVRNKNVDLDKCGITMSYTSSDGKTCYEKYSPSNTRGNKVGLDKCGIAETWSYVASGSACLRQSNYGISETIASTDARSVNCPNFTIKLTTTGTGAACVVKDQFGNTNNPKTGAAYPKTVCPAPTQNNTCYFENISGGGVSNGMRAPNGLCMPFSALTLAGQYKGQDYYSYGSYCYSKQGSNYSAVSGQLCTEARYANRSTTADNITPFSCPTAPRAGTFYNQQPIANVQKKIDNANTMIININNTILYYKELTGRAQTTIADFEQKLMDPKIHPSLKASYEYRIDQERAFISSYQTSIVTYQKVLASWQDEITTRQQEIIRLKQEANALSKSDYDAYIKMRSENSLCATGTPPPYRPYIL